VARELSAVCPATGRRLPRHPEHLPVVGQSGQPQPASGSIVASVERLIRLE